MEMLYGVQIGILYDVVFKNVTKRSGRICYLGNHKKIQYEWYLKTNKKQSCIVLYFSMAQDDPVRCGI